MPKEKKSYIRKPPRSPPLTLPRPPLFSLPVSPSTPPSPPPPALAPHLSRLHISHLSLITEQAYQSQSAQPPPIRLEREKRSEFQQPIHPSITQNRRGQKKISEYIYK